MIVCSLHTEQPKKAVLFSNTHVTSLETVITSSTKEPDDATTSFFQRVLTALQSKDKGSHRSLSQFIELALVETTSLLNAREIGILKQNNSANPGPNQSPGEHPEETRRNDPGPQRRNTEKPQNPNPDQAPGETPKRSKKDNSEPAHKIIKKSPLEVYRESILQVVSCPFIPIIYEPSLTQSQSAIEKQIHSKSSDYHLTKTQKRERRNNDEMLRNKKTGTLGRTHLFKMHQQ